MIINNIFIYLFASMEPLIHDSFIGKSNTSFSLRLFGEMKSSNLHFEKVMSFKKKFMTNFEILIPILKFFTTILKLLNLTVVQLLNF